jgi:hypothetical protein
VRIDLRFGSTLVRRDFRIKRESGAHPGAGAAPAFARVIASHTRAGVAGMSR